MFKVNKANNPVIYAIKLLIVSIFWMLLIFCIGRFVLQKTFLTYNAWIETRNLPIVSAQATSQDLENIKVFKKQLFYRRIVNSTLFLRGFEEELISDLEKSYHKIIQQEGLSPFQKSVVNYLSHLYANCCSYDLDSQKGYEAFENLALVDITPDEYDIWLNYLAGAIYWVGHPGFRTRSQYKIDSSKSYIINPLVYSIGEKGFRYNAERNPQNFKMLVKATVSAIQRINKDFPQDQMAQKLKFILTYDALKIKFLQKHMRQYMPSPYNCAKDILYHLSLISEDFFNTQKLEYIQSDISLKELRKAYAGGFREKCQIYKSRMKGIKGDRW